MVEVLHRRDLASHESAEERIVPFSEPTRVERFLFNTSARGAKFVWLRSTIRRRSAVRNFVGGVFCGFMATRAGKNVHSFLMASLAAGD
jgi:hypothetical protein